MKPEICAIANNNNEKIHQDTKPAEKPKSRAVGIILIALSFVLYGCLLIIPFIPYPVGTKAVVSTILIITGEISFWAGGFILGRELVMKYRKYFNPLRWFKKEKEQG